MGAAILRLYYGNDFRSRLSNMVLLGKGGGIKNQEFAIRKTVNYRARMLIPTVVEKNMTDLEFRSEARA